MPELKQLFPLLLCVVIIMAVVVALTAFNQNTDNRNYAASVPPTGVMTYKQQLPPDVPAFPIPETAVIEQSQRKVEGTRVGFTVDLSIASQSMQTLREFYTQKLSESGWEILAPFEGSPQTREVFLQAQKDGRKLNITIEKDGDEVEIALDFPFSE